MGCVAVLAATPALADELRDLCTERPGLNTPACTVDPGHVQVELGLADWTRDRQPDSLTDTILAGDLLARIGVGNSTELRFGWTAYGHERERDRTSGDVSRARGTGDITLGLKQNLASPDGSGFAAAIVPTVSLPVGRDPAGAGTWSGSLLLAVTYELSPAIQLELTPEVDAAADEDRNGRHLAWGSTAGVDFRLTDDLDLDVDIQAIRDRDPEVRSTQLLAAASLAYKLGKNAQIDVGGVAGLNHASPDVEAYAGIVRRF